MPKYPATPHLYAYQVNGQTRNIVRAASVAEARDFMASRERVDFVKIGPDQAFIAASDGVMLFNAKPEYEEIEVQVQASLFQQAPISHVMEVRHEEPDGGQ